MNRLQTLRIWLVLQIISSQSTINGSLNLTTLTGSQDASLNTRTIATVLTAMLTLPDKQTPSASFALSTAGKEESRNKNNSTIQFPSTRNILSTTSAFIEQNKRKTVVNSSFITDHTRSKYKFSSVFQSTTTYYNIPASSSDIKSTEATVLDSRSSVVVRKSKQIFKTTNIVSTPHEVSTVYTNSTLLDVNPPSSIPATVFSIPVKTTSDRINPNSTSILLDRGDSASNSTETFFKFSPNTKTSFDLSALTARPTHSLNHTQTSYSYNKINTKISVFSEANTTGTIENTVFILKTTQSYATTSVKPSITTAKHSTQAGLKHSTRAGLKSSYFIRQTDNLQSNSIRNESIWIRPAMAFAISSTISTDVNTFTKNNSSEGEIPRSFYTKVNIMSRRSWKNSISPSSILITETSSHQSWIESSVHNKPSKSEVKSTKQPKTTTKEGVLVSTPTHSTTPDVHSDPSEPKMPLYVLAICLPLAALLGFVLAFAFFRRNKEDRRVRYSVTVEISEPACELKRMYSIIDVNAGITRDLVTGLESRKGSVRIFEQNETESPSATPPDQTI